MILLRNLMVPVLVLAGSIAAAVIKTGDVIEISVSNHPEFSGRFAVSETGTIDYPLLADEPVVSISTAELMNHLTFRLARSIDNPLVIVSIVENPEISVNLLGQIDKPGPVTTYEGASIQEILAKGGGAKPQADLSRVKIVPPEGGDRAARYFDLNTFLNEGNIDGTPRVTDGTTIILLTREKTNKIKVIGGVVRPGFFEPQEKVNIFEMIYLAGGPAEKADLSRVRRISKEGESSVEEIIDVQKYIDDGNMDDLPMVTEGDVIIVYTKWFDWKTLLSILNNTLLFIVTLQAFAGIFGS